VKVTTRAAAADVPVAEDFSTDLFRLPALLGLQHRLLGCSGMSSPDPQYYNPMRVRDRVPLWYMKARGEEHMRNWYTVSFPSRDIQPLVKAFKAAKP
jgi:hypothetical protein